MVSYCKEWSKKKLGEFIRVQRGASPRPIEAYLTLSSNGVNWIKIGDAPRDSKYITQTKERITLQGSKYSVHVNKGEFILSNSMSFGRPYILSLNGCIHDGWLRLYDFLDEADTTFLYYLLSSKNVQQQYVSFASGSGVQNLNKKLVQDVEVYIPDLKEQQAIADTLTTFDNYIADLNALVEKKKAVREGVLEDLMSGKTRLDGFSGEWKEVGFEQVIKPKARIGWQGLKKDEYLRNGYSYLICGTDFENGTISFENIWYVSKERYDMDPNIQVLYGDVLVTKDGTIGKVALVPQIDKPAVLNSGVFVFKTSKEVLREFLYRVLISSTFKNFISLLSAGSTIKHLYQKDLKNFRFSIPVDLKEQQAIANTLTAMDDEVRDLEAKRDKMIDIRDGAMDDLLTGRVRLPL